MEAGGAAGDMRWQQIFLHALNFLPQKVAVPHYLMLIPQKNFTSHLHRHLRPSHTKNFGYAHCPIGSLAISASVV